MKASQRARILLHLKRGRMLTPLDALWKFGCERLAARIHELRGLGVPVRSRMIAVGPQRKRVAMYWISRAG